MLGQTEIVLLELVVLVVAVFFIWRSRQRVRTATKTGKIRGDYAVEDVLMKSGEKEAPRKTEPTLAPEAEGKSVSPAAAADYTVQRGDSLWKIALLRKENPAFFSLRPC